MNPFTGFSHIYLPVRDVDESIDFYTKNLGFRLLRKYTLAEGAAPSAYLELGEVLLELTKARRPLPAEEGNVEPRIGLAVTDMDAAWADLTSKGVEPVREPYDARTFWGGGGGAAGPGQGPERLRHLFARMGATGPATLRRLAAQARRCNTPGLRRTGCRRGGASANDRVDMLLLTWPGA